ncbi:hypothetical protein GYMLUDRAFT_120723, partial [Collybiopsis luxurians FD-317 M1]
RIYQCVDCFDCNLHCQECLLHHHQSNPFHTVEHWNGRHFETATLYELGLVIHLGHSPLLPCIGHSNVQKFTVIDTDRIHLAAIRFCRCSHTILDHYQLLCAQLYPATLTAPQTAATFRFLEFFQMLSFMSKVSATEYYSTLERMSDNTGMNVPKSHSCEVLRMIHQWRHLQNLKRSGVGYAGVDTNQPGILAVKCPACPHPGINIPSNWYLEREKLWLYKVFFSLDANFRLTQFNVSSEERDPGLNKGQAYMVDNHILQQFIAIFQGQWPPEKSDCSDHNAVKLANRRGDHNLATTGLALSSCARHDTIHAHSGVDLQLGKEYLLMDFSLLSSIRSFPNLPVTVSYDIIYQLLVPKFHLAAHKQDCVWSFSYNYAIGVGHTDGEGVERNWSTQNSLSGSTKKMGPGSRCDTLDDHFGDHNWQKIISIANHIHNKALEAAKVQEQMVLAYQDACQGINNSTQTLWRKMVMDWEQDPDKKNQTHMSP